MSVNLKTLKNTIARITEGTDTVETEIPDMVLYRRNEPTTPQTAMYPPTVCLITQGAKRVILGTDTYMYDPSHFLLTSVDIPTTVQVVKASKQKPCLGLVLKLDMRQISQLVVDGNLPLPRKQPSNRGMALGKVTDTIIEAFVRLVNLLNEPNDIPILAPLIKREIYYRLLIGDQGTRLRQMASAGSPGHQIAKAIDWLKNNYSKSLRVEELASSVHMSTSTFHHHFRTMTAMSPLQYQKWLRLNEARRLMLTESFDAGTAAFEVGYESPSQFSREYSRMFGDSPLRDITSLRQTAVAAINTTIRKTY